MLPVDNLAEQFPSLAGIQRFFDKVRAAGQMSEPEDK